MQLPRGQANRRNGIRFDCSFPISVSHPLFGTMCFVARNLSFGGMFIEASDLLPLGSIVRVHFGDRGHHMTAKAEVRNHYFLNYGDHQGPRALAGMGLRFLGFEMQDDQAAELVH